MRNFIDIITEARRGLAPIGEMRAKVFWNPRHSDLLALLARSIIGDVRGSWNETECETLVAIWPARILGHWNFHNECYAREGIIAKRYLDFRVTRDLLTLEEERYWRKNTHYEGDGFYCAFAEGAGNMGNVDPMSIPEIKSLFGDLKTIER